MRRELVILYGDVSATAPAKTLSLIRGELTCGYRDYARRFGTIVYPFPMRPLFAYEHSAPDQVAFASFIASKPDAVLWVVKTGGPRRDAWIRAADRRKLYYSCGASDLVYESCDFSLVGTEKRARVHPSCRVWVKGKDADFWQSRGEERIYDYVLLGRDKPGKNQKLFLQHLRDELKTSRRVVWVGGSRSREAYAERWGTHEVEFLPMLSPDRVRCYLSSSRVGILFTKYKNEGFPQSFLEMAMCGTPVVYSAHGPHQASYFHDSLAAITDERGLIMVAEALRERADAASCRTEAVRRFELEVSYQCLMRIIQS